jgi:hypothetical protein
VHGFIASAPPTGALAGDKATGVVKLCLTRDLRERSQGDGGLCRDPRRLLEIDDAMLAKMQEMSLMSRAEARSMVAEAGTVGSGVGGKGDRRLHARADGNQNGRAVSPDAEAFWKDRG